MANVNWKILSLLTVILLAALGLQAGAIKIMLNLARPSDTPASAGVRTAPGKPTAPVAAANAARHQADPPEERTASDPAPPVREPKPAGLVADPPHLAESPAKPVQPASPHGESSPEAHQTPVAAPAPPPSAEAALVAAETKPQPAAGGHAATPPVVTAVPAPVAPSAEANSAPEPVVESELQEPAWLKTRNPKHYTVQLYSGKDIDALKEIAAASTSTEPQAYYSTGTRSGPWYSLVAGDYPDSASAQAAAAKLSVRSPALKPWVRRFDEIQAKMR
jgi:DamX protein